MADPQKKTEYVTIRMLPGKGKMLVGRKWRTVSPDGEITETQKRPRNMLDDGGDCVDVYLGERERLADGSIGDGPTLEVQLASIAHMLDKNGKPCRLIDGYMMQRETGQETNDPYSNNRPVQTRDSWSPTAVPGVVQDAPFEIVSRRTA